MTSTITKLTATATGCVALGLGAGALLNAQAAAPAKSPAAKTAKQQQKHHRAGPAEKLARRAVHGELTVPTKDGMKTVRIDRGTLTAVSGTRLTIDESTKKVKGATVTVDVPAGAKVRSDGKATTLTALKPGQKVAVLQLPKRTVVRARTARP